MRNILIFSTLFAASWLLVPLGGCVVENEDGDGEQVVISAECNWYGGVECELACDDFEFWVSCEGEMDIECDPHCDQFEIEAGCSASCEGGCYADCEVDPGTFDCEAYCSGNCEANCEGECSASGNEAECSGHCDSYCEGECSASCDVELPELDCEAGCEASCEGECYAEANIDCHLCNVDVYLNCESEMNINCHGGCDADGVLECNGEFIDRKDLDAAIDWVRDNMTAEVSFEGDAECHGNSCSAEGSCEFKCAVGSTGGKGAATGIVLFLLGALSFVFTRRR